MVLLIWLGSPFVVGAILGAAFARSLWSAVILFLVGVGIGAVIFVYAFLSSPTQPPHCSDCGLYWGHWWEPGFLLLFLVIGYGAWVIGIGIGAGIRGTIRALREPVRHDDLVTPE